MQKNDGRLKMFKNVETPFFKVGKCFLGENKTINPLIQRQRKELITESVAQRLHHLPLRSEIPLAPPILGLDF